MSRASHICLHAASILSTWSGECLVPLPFVGDGRYYPGGGALEIEVWWQTQRRAWAGGQSLAPTLAPGAPDQTLDLGERLASCPADDC